MKIYIFSLLAGFFLCQAAFPVTIHVPGDQPTIQAGIDAAVNQDLVLVGAGTYAENIDFKGKAITVRSLDGPGHTILDGSQSGSVVVFIQGEGTDSVLDGFTITNGTGSLDPGGWISGGGIYCQNSSPSIKNNIIHGNRVDGHGGGVGGVLSGSILTGNTLYDNHNGAGDIPGWGGGVGFTYSWLIIENNTFHDNTTSYAGGAIFAKQCSPGYPVIRHNIIFRNEAVKRGGGVFTSYCESVELTGNIIYENRSPTGGGIHYSECVNSNFLNNVVHGNTALGATGKGGGIFVNYNAALTITNTIFWGNSGDKGPEIYVGLEQKPSTLVMIHCDVEGGSGSMHKEKGCTFTWGPGNIIADPLFMDPGAGDFHLPYNSPCRDSGSSAGVSLPGHDFEGDPRITDTQVDMGADEFHTHLYYTGDAVPGGQVEIKVIETPHTGPVLLFVGSGLLDPPLTIYFGDWYLGFPLLHQMGLGVVLPPGGHLILPVALPLTLPVPVEIPFQAFTGNWLTNPCILRVEG